MRYFDVKAEIMGKIKTIVSSLGLILISSTSPLAETNLGFVFAECAGRFSAEREHAWLTGNPEADYYEARRSAFVALLDATQSSATARRSLSHRIDAKMAHASLLTLATFGSDTDRAARAKRLAARHIGTCQSLLLDG